MCGIAGQWTRSNRDFGPQMSAALNVLRHRGPDDCGHAAFAVDKARLLLGHTRLSIIDLSAGGHQPMHRHARYSMVYNGEIYNYRELREELESTGECFSSDSDSEVLLAAWARWGEAALPRLKGMFAFAVFDSEQWTLTLARDAFGIKPLAYAAPDGHFAFASEIPALRILLPSDPQLNYQRAYDYLVAGSYDDGEETFFEDVKHLLPGHVLRFDVRRGAVSSVRRWWWPGIEQREPEPFSQSVERVREMFLYNVRLHLRSDVPLGAALSGGIDSSAIVCAMRYVEPHMPIHSFTYVARGYSVNEEPWADLVNAHVGAVVHKVTAKPEELLADLEDMLRAQGEPFGSTSIYAQYRVFKLARESGIKVALEGQGADELFAGYNGYPGAVLRGMLGRGEWTAAASFIRAWSSWPGRSMGRAALLLGRELVPPRLLGLAHRLAGRSPSPPWLDAEALRRRSVRLGPPRLEVHADSGHRPLAAALRRSLTQDGLPGLLRHGDRNSMRWSIESRVPFLTTDLAEFVLGLPDDYLISRGGQTKRVLRAALRGIVPDPILDRRDKVGFATPEREWLLQIAESVRSWLSDTDEIGFFRSRQLLAEFDAAVAGRRPFDWQVWRWVNFVRWHHLVLRRS